MQKGFLILKPVLKSDLFKKDRAIMYVVTTSMEVLKTNTVISAVS